MTVDEALEQARVSVGLTPISERETTPFLVLAAEVRRLREETKLLGEQLQSGAVYAVNLRAKLQLVLALPNNWRSLASTVNDPTSPSIYVDCAEELERVLNDG